MGSSIRRRLGGTFSNLRKYPEGYQKHAFALTQTILFAAIFAVLAVLIGGQLFGSTHTYNPRKMNNRQIVAFFAMVGATIRTVQILLVDLYLACPDVLRLLLVAAKDWCWFACFAILFAGFLEIQFVTYKKTNTVNAFRPHLITVIAIFSLLKLIQMGFELKDGDSGRENTAETVLACYMVICFLFGFFWSLRLRLRLRESAKKKQQQGGRKASVMVGGRMRVQSTASDNLENFVDKMTGFIMWETIILLLMAALALLDYTLKANEIIIKEEGEEATYNDGHMVLSVKVVRRFVEVLMVFGLYQMIVLRRFQRRRLPRQRDNTDSNAQTDTNNTATGAADNVLVISLQGENLPLPPEPDSPAQYAPQITSYKRSSA